MNRPASETLGGKFLLETEGDPPEGEVCVAGRVNEERGPEAAGFADEPGTDHREPEDGDEIAEAGGMAQGEERGAQNGECHPPPALRVPPQEPERPPMHHFLEERS